MSEVENPVLTIARLLRTQLRVVKDTGALANVAVTGEWQNAEALKGYDGYITVGLVESTDQKLELTGKARKRTATLRINVWTTDQISAGETGRTMRSKIVEEVNRVIRQNRINPAETLYDFFNVGPISGPHKAFEGKAEASPNDLEAWTQLSSEDFQKLAFSEDNRCQISHNESGEFAAMLFGFKLGSRPKTVKKIILSFEGYASAPSGDSAHFKIWNAQNRAWQKTQSSDFIGEDKTVMLNVDEEPSNFIDSDGYVWMLAVTANPADNETSATLICDYVSCKVKVNGITYCDVVNYRNIDHVDVKPFIFRTEFILKSWFLEKIGV